MYKVLIVVATFSLVGCASSPERVVYNAHLGYDVALSGAVAYRKLPECPAGAPLCHDKQALATLRRADEVAFEALSNAQKVVRQPKVPQSAAETAATWAKEAVNAFLAVVNKVKEK